MQKNKKPLLILIAGSSGSGKSTIAQKILSNIPSHLNSITICQDRYYIDQSHSNVKIENVNFDHPNAFDWELMKSDLIKLLNNEEVNLPIYDYVNHCRKFEFDIVKNQDIIIFEGIHVFYNEEITKLANLLVFVEVPRDESFIRRLERDIKYRGRTIDSVIHQWRSVVRPMYDAFIEPLKYKAHIVIPWTNTETRAVEIISQGITYLIHSNELLSKK